MPLPHRLLYLLPAFVLIGFAAPCSAMKVAELAAKTFVRRALENPSSPSSVISFYYGVDYDSEDGRQALRRGVDIRPMEALWYGGGPEYDKLCEPFAPVVREAGHSKLEGNQWEGSVSGTVAQMLLCDQLSRNIFRGTKEAFAYDETSLVHARALVSQILDLNDASSAPLIGEVYPPFMANVVTALMHSEDSNDHTNAVSLLNHAKDTTSDLLQDWWDNHMVFEMEHKRVIDRFGRYPHRNGAKGRESTDEEKAWLADTANLPLWALSQLPGPVEEC